MRADPSSLSGAELVGGMPGFVPPQLATLVTDAPRGDEWSHEVKFDGYRALARIEAGKAEIRSRNNKDWSRAYAGLAEELAALPVREALLDGEVVAQMPDGTTSFEALRHLARVPGRDATDDTRTSRGAMTASPAIRLVYYAFDLLYLDGYELLGAPLEERRRLLRSLIDQAPSAESIRFSDHITGDGAEVLRQACGLGLEGVVSKKAASHYRPGTRGPDWLKTKCRHEQEFVIGGYTEPTGGRVGFGALLLGVYEQDRLRYVSRVGTGFDEGLLRSLGGRLRALESSRVPFDVNAPRADAKVHWVRPELVAQVSFLEWTSSGGLRHPSFKGLREDKSATQVVAESPSGAETAAL